MHEKNLSFSLALILCAGSAGAMQQPASGTDQDKVQKPLSFTQAIHYGRGHNTISAQQLKRILAQLNTK